jgi:hypothetical protein
MGWKPMRREVGYQFIYLYHKGTVTNMKFHKNLLLGVSLVFLLSVVSGEAIMQLMPPIQEVKVERGHSDIFTITVKNAGDEDVPSMFSALNMDITRDGAPIIADSTFERGFGNWILLDPAQVTIKANEAITLTGTVTVPRDAEGGYYALIRGVFTTTTIPLEAEKSNIKGSGVELQSQAVVAVLLTVPSSHNKAMVYPDTLLLFPKGEDTSAVGFENREKKGWKAILPIKNDGNIHTRVTGNIGLWSEAGTRIESAPLTGGRGYVLPNRIRNFYANGDNVLSDGYYMIRIALQTSENRRMSNSYPFAIYEGKVYPGAVTDQLSELIRASSPGFVLREPFAQKTVTPGGFTYLIVQMVNTRKDTLNLFPRKMEWKLDAIGQASLGSEPELQPRSCTSWIAFPEETIQILPGGTGSYKMKITVPADISGEYYAAIVFDPDRPRPDTPSEFLETRTQLLALSSPKNLSYQIEVDSVTVKKESSEKLVLYRFYFTVRSTGNAHCYAYGNILFEKQVAEGIYGKVGKTLEFGDRQTFLLPGGERKFEIDVPNLEKGKYRLTLATNYKEEAQPIVKTQRFTVN